MKFFKTMFKTEKEKKAEAAAKVVIPAQDIPAGLQASRSVKEGLSTAYTVKHVLGSGAEGTTWLCVDQQSHSGSDLIAVKMVKLPLPREIVQAIMREIKIQAELGDGHLNIIKPKEVVLTSHYLGLVMEYASGGTLSELLSDRYEKCQGQGLIIGEDESRYLFRQVVNAVDFCHRNKVVHRDLKLDNTLLSAHKPPRVKLCDFGFSRDWGEAGASTFSTVIGTPDYMSPQLTVAKLVPGQVVYDGIKADVWAMGVLLCVMLLGRFPFEGNSVDIASCKCPVKKIWLQQHASGRWRDNANLTDVVKLLSPSVVDLLDKMFELDENKRCDVAGIMQHPWFLERCSPHFEEALAAVQREQHDIDERLASGAYKSKKRDQAISDLIMTAASDEFRRQAAAPVAKETLFVMLARIDLTSVRPWYPKVDRRSVRKSMRCMASEMERHRSVIALGKKTMEEHGVAFGPNSPGNANLPTTAPAQPTLNGGGGGRHARDDSIKKGSLPRDIQAELHAAAMAACKD